jgi:uncharacterized membrane protein YjfL (UPF0719 family)
LGRLIYFQGQAVSMAVLSAIFDIVIAIIQLIFGVALALFSITVAINILNRVTKEINEFEELRKKNLAVGVYVAGILIAVGNVVGQAVSGVSKAVVPGAFNVSALIGGLVQLFIGLPLAIVVITWAQNRVYGWLVKAASKLPGVEVEKFNIQDELKNGNLAVAIVLFGTFLAISLVISQGIAFLSEPISSALRAVLG